MINWMYYPQNKGIQPHLRKVIDVFLEEQEAIDSATHLGKENLVSDVVLEYVRPGLEKAGYSVERSKKKDDKIRVPVLCGLNGVTSLAFEVDAYSAQEQTVIEVEAGRAVANYQFLKDFYEACMMQNVKYLCIAVKNRYGVMTKGHYRMTEDFDITCNFFNTLYISNRLQIPLEGILIIGY